VNPKSRKGGREYILILPDLFIDARTESDMLLIYRAL
jgi:hypothetical protein